MEIPVINRVTDFEASFNSLNNPSLISRVLSIFELGRLYHAHRIWKWGALFVTLIYAFSSVVNRIKILMLHYHNKSKSLLASEPLLSHHFDDEFYSDEDEDDDVCSTSGSSDDEDEDEDEDETEDNNSSSYEDLTELEDDFRVKGCFGYFSESPRQKRKFKLLRQRRSVVDIFSLPDLVNGNGVVKLWDGLGLGVGVKNSFSSLAFNNNDGKFRSLFAEIPAISMSPAVLLSTSAGENGRLGLGVWDMRTGRKSLEVHAEWRSDRQVKLVGVDAGQTGKVYVRDDVTMGLAAGDVRKVDAPLEESTNYEEDMWWDADGVSQTDE